MNVFDEQNVSDMIGLTREDVRDARELLQEGLHWQRVGNVITLTEMGVRLVLRAFELDHQLIPTGFWPDLQKNARRGKAFQTVATFYRAGRNPRVCEGLIEKERVRIQVHHTKNFVLGMEIPVEHVEGDLYRITRTAPRYRGRW